MAAAELPDGTTVGGYTWVDDGFLTSSRTTTMFQCGPKSKPGCTPLVATSQHNLGYIQIPTSLLHGAGGAATGALLAPRAANPGGGLFINAPETLVQQVLQPAK